MGVSTARSQCPNRKGGAAEGGTDDWAEVVTRSPYRKVRLDHLLSKEEEVEDQMCFTVELSRKENIDPSGGDALRGHTRSHPEHDG